MAYNEEYYGPIEENQFFNRQPIQMPEFDPDYQWDPNTYNKERGDWYNPQEGYIYIDPLEAGGRGYGGRKKGDMAHLYNPVGQSQQTLPSQSANGQAINATQQPQQPSQLPVQQQPLQPMQQQYGQSMQQQQQIPAYGNPNSDMNDSFAYNKPMSYGGPSDPYNTPQGGSPMLQMGPAHQQVQQRQSMGGF